MLVARTGETTVGSGLVVLVRLAGYALFSVEVRILIGTRSTGTEFEIVYLSKGTREAQFFVEIEVLRKEAGHAYPIVPEVVVLTLACLSLLVVSLTQWAGLTVLALRIEVGGRHTSGTLLAVEVGQIGGAVHTFFRGDIVDLLIRAEDTGKLREIEVLRSVAFDAVGSVPVKFLRTSTGFLHHDHASLACLTMSIGRVPD